MSRSKKIVVKRKKIIPVVSFVGSTWYPDVEIEKDVTGYDLCIQKSNQVNDPLVIRCDSTMTGQSIYGHFSNKHTFYNAIRNWDLSNFRFYEILMPKKKHNMYCALKYPESKVSHQLDIREAFVNLLGRCVRKVLKNSHWSPENVVFKRLNRKESTTESDGYVEFLVIYPIQFPNSVEQDKFWRYVQYFLNTLFKKTDSDLRDQLMYFDEQFVRRDMIQFPMDLQWTELPIDTLRLQDLISDATSSTIVKPVLDMTPPLSEFQIPNNLNKHALINLLRSLNDIEIDGSIFLDDQIKDNFIALSGCQCYFTKSCHYDDFNAYQYISISYDGALQYRCTAEQCANRVRILGNGLFRKYCSSDFPAVIIEDAKARAEEWFARVDLGMNQKYNSFDALLADLLNRDDGVAEVFSDMYENCIKITNAGSDVYLWNGTIWEIDECHLLPKLVTKSMRAVIRRIQTVLNVQIDQFENQKCDDCKKLRNKVSILTSLMDKVNSGVTFNIVKALTSNFYTANFDEEQNRHPYKIISKDGMVNLKTGQIKEPLPEDNLTIGGKYKYYQCSCPLGECGKEGVRCDSELNLAFVEEAIRMIMQDDEERYNHLRWIIGYCLTGDAKKKLAFFGYGEKYNGKSLLSNLIIDIMPMYAKSMDKSVVIKARQNKAAGSASPELTHLNGIRLAILNETSEDDVINEEQVKSITGRDKKNVREVYGKKAFDMDMDFAPWILSNFKPKISLSDPAMWERVCPVTFPVSFLPNPDPTNPCHKKADEDLSKKFKMFVNKERFFNWLVRCCLYYVQNQNKAFPKVITDEIDGYKRECNVIAEFVEEKSDRFVVEINATTSLKDFMEDFREWCKERGMQRKPSNKKITEMLRNLKCDINTETNCIVGMKNVARIPMVAFTAGDGF